MNSEIADQSKSKNDAAPRYVAVPAEIDAGATGAQLVVAATFTADSLLAPITFWMRTLDMAADVSLSPYGQLLQGLLDPRSLMGSNATGWNILLVRIEDWFRDRDIRDREGNLDHAGRVGTELENAVRALRDRSGAAILVFLCPDSSNLPDGYAPELEEIRRDLGARLGTIANVHCWAHADLSRLYPVIDYEDAHADRIGHIPYTDEYFAAIATLIARRIAAVVKPPCKVIALDCDNTLWAGVCGEDGTAGVQVTPAHRELQRALVGQHDAGMLLCLCSKNNPDDVAAVFSTHPDMPLREEHLVCTRVNWSAKSTNLRSIADELGLPVDSFILLDDSGLECAEVRSNCPAVLTLQVPQNEHEMRPFLDHIWAFDRPTVSADAKRRTAQYKENRSRALARQSAADLVQFLASLALQVDVAPMQKAQLTRVAELVQRTNQFNLTGVRRGTSELETLWSTDELRCLVAHVRDRFGDYGLVGAVLFRRDALVFDVDTFVLSCRALGRGVEHRIVNELARVAQEEAVESIVLRYRQTGRNVPAWQFLEGTFAQFGSESADLSRSEVTFTIPTRVVLEARCGPETGPTDAAVRDADAGSPLPGRSPASTWHDAAARFRRPESVIRAIKEGTPAGRRGASSYVAPRSAIESAVADIWSELLSIDAVGAHDDFFKLGGDSLLAVRAVARFGSELGLDLPLFEFFEMPTVAQVAAKLIGASQSEPAIQRADRSAHSPLSWAQHRLWFIDQLENGSAAYHLPLALRLRGVLNKVALEQALDTLIARHEILRTTFVNINGEPVQQIGAQARFALGHVDLSDYAAQQLHDEIVSQASEELVAPFDLRVGPLLRGRLLVLSASDHVLLITMHHIISDGWSMAVLVRELGALYGAFVEERATPLPPLSVQYADYAQWQQQVPIGPSLQRQFDYWKLHLRGAPALLELPSDRPRLPVQSYRGADVSVVLDLELTASLKAFSSENNVTLAMTLHAAWVILLAKLSGQREIVVGVPVANRRRTELEGLIGLFVNTLAVRVELQGDLLVVDVLRRVKHALVAAYAHQDVPFEKVVEALRPVRSLSHSPIFQVMFVLQSVPSQAEGFAGLTLTREEVPLSTAQFDLLLSMREDSGEIRGTVNYATELFDAQTIMRWAGYFTTVLREMVEEPEQELSRLQLLGKAERERILHAFNETSAPYEQEKLIHQLIEEQVERAPAATALLYETNVLSYGELNLRANQLARCLRSKGVTPDQLVGICTERSIEMVVGLLGILKAGGAYVPLDPGYPPERLAYMLKDAAPRILLIEERLRAILPDTGAEVIALDSDWHRIASQPTGNLDPRLLGLSSDHLAYVIYTSGSTGQPKGAMNEHRALINRLQWMQREYQLSEADCVLQKTPFSFDVSVWEFFWTLMSGARLVMARSEGHKNPGYLRDLIESAGITRLHFVPSMLQAFLAHLPPGRCPSVRQVICSGEELPTTLQNKFLEILPQARLSNLYGPTEAAVDVTFWECRHDPHGSRVPIGRPIANTRMYVLDDHHQPVPIGVTGEIFIGGVGVGRGYHNRTDLTAERFLPDSFSHDPRARLYKTGDVGRWRVDGVIEYLGRNDHQVKIRGFRIELGEIEAQFARLSWVRDCVVVAREDAPGDKRLVAYLTPRDPATVPSVSQLRAHLRTVLPEYMVPSAFVTLERLPLTPNGKLDRRALPAPELGAYASTKYERPQGEVEEILAGIWQLLLRVERVGRQDNFFELGGHSLLVVQMMERLRRVGLSADLRVVFESSTLADLARALSSEPIKQTLVPPNLIPSGCKLITPEMLPLIDLSAQQVEQIVHSVPGGSRNVQDIYPLTPLQEGILFHHLLNDKRGDTYVVPTVLSVASRERLNDLVAALQGAIDRHDVLRTAVFWDQLPRAVQVVYRRATLTVEEVELQTDRDSRVQLLDWLAPQRQRMDLRQAPLWRMQVAADPAHPGQWYVLLQFHHIIGDVTSQEILIAELVAQLQGRGQTLEPRAPFRDHVAHSLAYARTDEAKQYFSDKLVGIDEPTAPFGLVDTHNDGSELEQAHRELNPSLARRIRVQAGYLGVSAATLFHAAWGIVVASTSDRDDVVFGTVLLGRLKQCGDSHRALGMLINTLPLRLQLRDATARGLVEQTQRELVGLLNHEQAALTVAQGSSAVGGSAPLFSSLLNYRHSVVTPDARWQSAQGITVVASRERTNYPINLSVDDAGDRFALVAQTDRRIDPNRVTTYMHTALESLVQALEHAPQTPATALTMLPEGERRQVIELFNATRTPYPKDESIGELFERQVRIAPDAVAVVGEGRSLTYAELNGRANQMARYLRAQGSVEGAYIPVIMKRSVLMLVAQIAILKSGAVYVPLDPELPPDRLGFMLKDCNARHVLADRSGRFEIAAQLHWLDCVAQADAITAHALDNLGPRASGSIPPAYVMYTSGSTGVPKGVLVPHHAVNRLAINNGYAQIERTDCIAHHSNPTFDASTFEVWATLLNGARLVVVPQDILLDGARFAELIEHERVSILWMSVGLFNRYTEILGGVLRQLRYVLVGGDALDPVSIARVLQAGPPRHLLNAYGPTECTTFSTTHLIDALASDAKSIPIGRPIANAQVYILDSRRQPVPIGVAGEIHIGGAGVACGYLNRPELTAQRFVSDPFSADPGARMYRTGDRAAWRRDGTIEFLGRNDQQVKIRGFRVELGEIETQLATHPRIAQAAVVLREDLPGGRCLVGYVVRNGAGPGVEELRGFLKNRLPEYMVPSALVILDSLPLTPTGKLNRRALPAPQLDAYATGLYESPEGAVEQALAAIWQELLGIEQIGRQSNFFELGGHSLLALRALSRIHQFTGTDLKVTDLYRSPTILELAARICAGTQAQEFVDISEATLDSGIRPLSTEVRVPAQAVLLTGGTGFVGRFLLVQLLRDTNATIYCLVRARSQAEAALRLRGALAEWDLWRGECEDRIIAVLGDLCRPRLGIDEETYRMLCREVDTIYHCGTSMNHLETYAMAKAANVDSAKELLKFSTQHKNKLVNYVSTLSVFSSSSVETARVVDETTAIDSERHPVAHGYAASKWIAEKIFMIAGERGIPCNIFRLGLIWADAQHGRYDELQRGYRVIKSCLLSGVGISKYRLETPPTPVDYAAQAIVLLASRHPQGQGTFHISSLNQPIEGIFESCNELLGTSLQLVPHYQWIVEMKRRHRAGESLPVVPLIEFAFSMNEASFLDQQRVQSNIRFDCTRTQHELDRAGVVAQEVDEAVFNRCLCDMLARDEQLQVLQLAGDSMGALPFLSERKRGLRCGALRRSEN